MSSDQQALRLRLSEDAFEVAVILSRATGRKWEAVQYLSHDEEHILGGAVKDDRGLTLRLGILQARPDVRVVLSVPTAHDQRGRYIDVYKDGKRLLPPSITVSACCTVERMAKQIKSRLFPDAEAYWLEANKRADAQNAHEKLTADTAQRFAEVAGGKSEDIGHDTEVYALGERWEIAGDMVSVQRLHLSAEEAVAVGTLLRTMRRQTAEEDEAEP